MEREGGGERGHPHKKLRIDTEIALHNHACMLGTEVAFFTTGSQQWIAYYSYTRVKTCYNFNQDNGIPALLTSMEFQPCSHEPCFLHCEEVQFLV